jgi:hypothetical protein
VVVPEDPGTVVFVNVIVCGGQDATVSLAVKDTDGDANTVMYEVTVLVFDPLALVAVNFTVYVPAVTYVVEGFCKVEVVPLPRSQLQLVGLPVLRSVKFTTIGEQPDVVLALKLAIGCAFDSIGDTATSPTHNNA